MASMQRICLHLLTHFARLLSGLTPALTRLMGRLTSSLSIITHWTSGQLLRLLLILWLPFILLVTLLKTLILPLVVVSTFCLLHWMVLYIEVASSFLRHRKIIRYKHSLAVFFLQRLKLASLKSGLVSVLRLITSFRMSR